MAMCTFCIAVLIALCGFLTVPAGPVDSLKDIVAVRDRRAVADEAKLCTKKLLSEAKSCCQIPADIYSPSEVLNCLKNSKTTTTKVTKIIAERRKRATKDGKDSKLTSTGDLNLAAVIRKFNVLEKDEGWQKVFSAAAKKCGKELGDGPEGDDKVAKCRKCGPRQVMKCINKEMLVNCPQPMGKKDKCDTRRKKLLACNAFATCAEEKGGQAAVTNPGEQITEATASQKARKRAHQVEENAAEEQSETPQN